MNDNYNYDDTLRRKVFNLNYEINSMSVTRDSNYINSMHRLRNDTYEFYYSYYYNCSGPTNQAAVNSYKNSGIALDIVERLCLIIDDYFMYNLDDYLGILESMRKETVINKLNYYYPTLFSKIINTINTEKKRTIERESLKKLSSPKINDIKDKDFDKIDRDIDKPIKNKPDKKIDQLNDMFVDKIDTFKPKIDKIGGRKRFL